MYKNRTVTDYTPKLVPNVSGTRILGKFLSVDGRRFLIKGVSYGTFAPDANGALVPDAGRVSRDFDGVAELGANTVRTYTPPPIFLLDEASRRGLRVMAGVPWSQHLAFLDSPRTAREIRNTVAREVRRLASHPATLLVAVGNEIPPSVVRWYGRRRIERFLRELFEEAKAAELGAYVARLHHIAGAAGGSAFRPHPDRSCIDPVSTIGFSGRSFFLSNRIVHDRDDGIQSRSRWAHFIRPGAENRTLLLQPGEMFSELTCHPQMRKQFRATRSYAQSSDAIGKTLSNAAALHGHLRTVRTKSAQRMLRCCGDGSSRV